MARGMMPKRLLILLLFLLLGLIPLGVRGLTVSPEIARLFTSRPIRILADLETTQRLERAGNLYKLPGKLDIR
jgi:hypothetical protein